MFSSVSDTQTPQGILCICSQKHYNMEEIVKQSEDNALFILCENINDPGNLGTIIRTADACNASGVFLSENCVDVYNNKVLRSTMGSIFHLPLIKDIEINNALAIFKKNNIKTFSTYLKGSINLFDADFKGKSAIIIGNESKGISKETLELSDFLVKIPMPGNAESLNASVAASIVMYEVVRQNLG